jgi:hypothetical protein
VVSFTRQMLYLPWYLYNTSLIALLKISMWEVIMTLSGPSSLAQGTKIFIRLELKIKMTGMNSSYGWKITKYYNAR